MHNTLQSFSKSPRQWADIYLTAESISSKFELVSVTTTKSDFVDLLYKSAADILCNQQINLTKSTLDKVAKQLIHTNQIFAMEYVKVHKGIFSVCIDKAVLTDDDMWDVIQMTSDALEQLKGDDGIVYFGTKIYYTLTDVKTMLKDVEISTNVVNT
jgi:hypothetical protein